MLLLLWHTFFLFLGHLIFFFRLERIIKPSKSATQWGCCRKGLLVFLSFLQSVGRTFAHRLNNNTESVSSVRTSSSSSWTRDRANERGESKRPSVRRSLRPSDFAGFQNDVFSARVFIFHHEEEETKYIPKSFLHRFPRSLSTLCQVY